MTLPTRLDELPLFADDLAIGRALLGGARAKEWVALAPMYEGRGLPRVDRLLGGRYVPAVRRFFDREYGLEGPGAVSSPDGSEDWSAWKTKRGAKPRA